MRCVDLGLECMFLHGFLLCSSPLGGCLLLMMKSGAANGQAQDELRGVFLCKMAIFAV